MNAVARCRAWPLEALSVLTKITSTAAATFALSAVLLLLPSVTRAQSASRSATSERPNIVIIYADDLGYGDLACYGNPSIRTPNLDRMAAQGMRFTDFYSAGEVCTPSRAALLTGRYAIRSGMCDYERRVLLRRSKGHLPADEITLPELLKERGYATGMVGKWHLGVWSINPEGHPTKHGFDYFFGLPHSNDMDPAPDAPKAARKRLDQQAAWWNSPLYRGTELVEQPTDQSTLTRRYTEEAVKYIREHKEKPFFLYYAHTFPHIPLFASERFRGKSAAGLYGDVVEELDWSVGEVLEALKREGLEKKTIVVFSSDNGPWVFMEKAGGSAGPLRDGKGSTWEGGMREPAIAWWPGKVPAGVVQHEIATTMDLFVTFAKLAGATVPTDRPIDGVDIAPLLFGTGSVERDAFFYYRGEQLYAARLGPWKAHFITRTGYGPDPAVAHDPPLLFNVAEDPGERYSVPAAERPEIVARIMEAVSKHRANLKPAPSQLVEFAE
jgi:arylsulfatase A-like enzyme